MKKAVILDLIKDMPDELDPEEVMYRIFLREKLEAAERAVAAGDVLTQDEVEAQSDEWLK